MKIGKLVKTHIKKVFQFCETEDHCELTRLMDKGYSKKTFDVNFPFCTEVTLILPEESKRYWTDRFLVQGKTVRVTSQWFDKSKEYFIAYLLEKNIATQDSLKNIDRMEIPSSPRARKTNSRYRGNAIGNAQNLLVRNILSNLGNESFTDRDWEETKQYFSNQCAYCGNAGDLVIEHAIPINKKSLGEHRLGNLIPSCKACNSKKADKDYIDFLGENNEKINKIQQYMDSRNYVPLDKNEQVAMILELAYKEVAGVSERYIAILNELFPNN
jgi:5-methylcytosine-specific restriction endonuclease McrA